MVFKVMTFPDQIEKWVNEGVFPGAHYLVTEHGEVKHQARLGQIDLEQQIAISDNSLYRLASATKIFVSVAFLRLVQGSSLNLTDPVSNVFPEFNALQVFNADGECRTAQNKMTMLDLLRHSCGYGYADKQSPHLRQAMFEANLMGVDDLGYDHWLHLHTLRGWIAALAKVPMEHEPGTRVSYGLGHDIAGAVIEEVSGLPLDEFMQQEVFEPLELGSTFFVVPEARAHNLTAFYNSQKNDDGPNRCELIETAKQSAFLSRPKAFSGGGGWDMLGNGGLVSNAADFTRLMQMIVDGGLYQDQPFLSSSHAELMCCSQSGELAGKDMLPGCEYSLGAAEVIDPKLYSEKGTGSSGPSGKIWWGGSTNTYFFYVPDKKRTGVFLSNVFPFGYKGAVFKFGEFSKSP